MIFYDDEYFMQQALKQALLAFDEEEVPIGAVVVINNKIVAKAYNQVEKLNDATAHAEILALTAAFNSMGSKYLPQASLYVTVEPCLMCSGALYWSKLERIVYGAKDEKNGWNKYFENNTVQHPFHPKAIITGGVLENECKKLMQDFFRVRR